MLDPEDAQRLGVAEGSKADAVVRHDALDLDAEASKELQCVEEKAQAGRPLFIGQDLRVGEARVVVDRQVEIFPAHASGVALASPVAGDPVTDAIELAQLLDVDVNDLAWGGAFVAANRLGRLQRRQPIEAEPLENAADGRRRNADLGGDLLAGVTLPAQSLDRRETALVSYVRGQEARGGWAPGRRKAVGEKGFGCAELGAERETTVDQTLIRGLDTAFRVFVWGLSSA